VRPGQAGQGTPGSSLKTKAIRHRLCPKWVKRRGRVALTLETRPRRTSGRSHCRNPGSLPSHAPDASAKCRNRSRARGGINHGCSVARLRLVALSAMARSACWASAWPGPRSAARHEAASAASSIVVLRGVSLAGAAECGEARGGERGLVDRRLGVLLEVAQQPAGGNARMPARVLARDQDRQLECIAEADPEQLPRRRLGDGQVAALDRPSKDA
jgi:hypothetical protein